MKILVADDEDLIRITLCDELEDAGHDVIAAVDGKDAISKLEKTHFDLVICDLVMPGAGGKEVQEAAKKKSPDSGFVLMTANPSVESSIDILKNGAIDYLVKPFEMVHLLQVVTRAVRTLHLESENRRLSQELDKENRFCELVGKSKIMQDLFHSIRMVAPTDLPVLVKGATGTGKELVARAVHSSSSRSENAFVAVNCAALSSGVLESELFGHEKGSFTGADRQRQGRFEAASGGTIFLDEVDDLPMDVQVTLLRILESGSLERVGSTVPIQVDIRLVSATKKDLLALVEQGTFREDLYFRLNGLCMDLPLLRDRREDIPLLVRHFLSSVDPVGKFRIDDEIMQLLVDADWRGNVRELKRAVDRLVLLNREGRVPLQLLGLPDPLKGGCKADLQWGRESLPDFLFRSERDVLLNAVQRCDGRKSSAAELLGIPLPTLKSKLRKFDIV